MNQRNMGNLENADGFARVTGPCGYTMEVWLKMRNDIVAEVTFMTDGCGTTIAAGSMITELAKGERVSQALRIGQEDVLFALDELPEESRHCALLAANTLKAAVKDYLTLNKDPWKRTYR